MSSDGTVYSLSLGQTPPICWQCPNIYPQFRVALYIPLPVWHLHLNVSWMLQTKCVQRELTSSISKPAPPQVHSSAQKLKQETWESLLYLSFSPSPPFCKLLTRLVNTTSKIVTESSIFTCQPWFTILSCLDHCTVIQMCVFPHSLLLRCNPRSSKQSAFSSLNENLISS